MIFEIQRYVEDHFAAKGLRDTDQYAIKVSNLYDTYRDPTDSSDEFLRRMRRIRTAFFANNSLQRGAFEPQFLKRLDRSFLKKKGTNPVDNFPGDVGAEKARLRRKPRSISRILKEYRQAVEARAVNSFWKSRQKNQLQSKPEAIGRDLLAVFIRGVLDGKGLSFSEVGSGIGFVDIVVLLSSTPHLIELKILKGKMTGVSQLETYMRTEGRNTGWLVLFDTRPSTSRTATVPTHITVQEGTISVLVIDINPIPPSKA